MISLDVVNASFLFDHVALFSEGGIFYEFWKYSVWLIRIGVAVGISGLALIQADWKPLSNRPKFKKLRNSHKMNLLGMMAILFGFLWILSSLVLGILPNLAIIITGTWVARQELVRMKIIRAELSQKWANSGRTFAVLCLLLNVIHVITRNEWIVL